MKLIDNLTQLEPQDSMLAETQVLYWLWDSLGLEVYLLGIFIFGYCMFTKKVEPKTIVDPDNVVIKKMEDQFGSGNYESVVAMWTQVVRMTWPSLRVVLRSFVTMDGDFGQELDLILNKHPPLCSTEILNKCLKDNPKQSLQSLLHIVIAFTAHNVEPGDFCYRRLIKFLSSQNCVATISRMKPTSRTYAGFLRAALKTRKLLTVTELACSMRDAGHVLPGPCIVQIVRLACEVHCPRDVFDLLPSDTEYPADAVASLLDCACKGNDIALVKQVHNRALLEGIPLLYPSYDALIKAYASQGETMALDLFDEMVEQFALSDGSLVSFITMCAESKFVQLAEKVVDYCKERRKPSLAMFSALMKVYSHARLFHKTCDVYESLMEADLEPDTVAFGCLIKAAVECGRLELARKLFRQSGNPDLLNYMSLIRAAGREKNMKKALDLLEELESSAIVVDTTCYNCVLDVCVSCGGWTEAADLFARMKRNGSVDVISYNTWMKGLTFRGEWSKVDEALVEMRARKLSPNSVTFNSLINSAIANGDMQNAWGFLTIMEEQLVPVDAFTCSIMIKGLKHSSQKMDIDHIMALIERSNVVPDEVLVNSLLDACVRLRDAKRLSQAVLQFKVLGVVPSTHAFMTLIKAYGHLRRMDQVWATWEEMTVQRESIPDESAYACLIDACVFNGDLNGAMRMFLEMKQRTPDYRNAYVMSTLIRGFSQRKELNKALAFYDEMRLENVTCNIVAFNTLIDGCTRIGDIDRATRLFKDMTESDQEPDLITYSTMIKGYSVQGDLDRALKLFAVMRQQGIQPDAILFNSILDGCARKHMRTLTEQVLADMEQSGIAPSNFTLSILVKLYGRCEDLNKAIEVVETLPVKYRFELNAQVYTCLMSACIANGKLDKAVEIFAKMKSHCVIDAKAYHTMIMGCLKMQDLDQVVSLIYEALNLNDVPNMPRVALGQELVDNVLFVLGRKPEMRQARDDIADRCSSLDIGLTARINQSARFRNEPFVRRSDRHSERHAWRERN
eukprot:GEMP01007502.1.p1 GENE.GEMP01007502.1~~GEMP01007502.1.p1  ORF type:complete len:1019 (+),score=234.19 GEMP01007502.1:105-3161(+)